MRPRRPKSEADGRDVRDVAIGLLARREHSRFELRYKLAARGFDAADVESALTRLQAESLLDDARFAEAYVRSRAERGFGPLKITQELRSRGVPDHTIEDYLKSPPTPWLDSARAQHRKRFGARPSRNLRDKARQARFLRSRGFSSEMIRQVLDGATEN